MAKARTSKTLAKIRERGEKIADTKGAVKKHSCTEWTVKSQSLKMLYVVVISSLGLVCSCAGSMNGSMLCKHVVAVNTIMSKNWKKVKRTLIKRQKIRCHHCKSENYTKHGIRKGKHKDEQRYRCKECGRTFSGMAGFVGRHFSKYTIVSALSMSCKGMSSAETAQQIYEDYTITVHPDTILRWIRAYSSLLGRYVKLLKICASFCWHVDEVYFKILGEERWLFAMMCGASRFILAYEISPGKTNFKPYKLFERAREQAVHCPSILVSDGLLVFIRAAERAFSCCDKCFTHVREIHMRNQFNNNNKYERLNSEFKGRISRMRGVKSEMPPMIRLMIIYHNFFRPHMGLGDSTPAKAAGIDIVSESGSDRADRETWVTMIQNAALNAMS